MEETQTINKPNKITLWFEENKSLLLKCLLFTFIFGLLAHAYGLFQTTLTHDTLNEYVNSYRHKISLGRFLQPILRFIMGEQIILPWTTGIFSILIISFSVFFVCKAFNFNTNKKVLIVSGIFVTNITVTCLVATFIHDLSADMLALMVSCFAFYFYVKNCEKIKFKNAAILSSLIIIISSLYQSYFSVTVSLILIYSILNLLKGNTIKEEFKKLLFGFLSIVTGLVLYLVVSFIISKITGAALYSTNYNSLGSLKNPIAMLKRIPESYVYFFNIFFHPYEGAVKSIYFITSIVICVINALLLIFGIVIIIKFIVSKKINWTNILLILALLIALPIAMNITYILSGVEFTYTNHTLIIFASWTFYIMIIEIFRQGAINFENFKFNKITKIVSFFIFVIIASNIQLSNACYVKKDLEQKATLSFMTRVVDRIEQMPNYVYGKTEIVFVGNFNDIYQDTESTTDLITGVDYVTKTNGMDKVSAITYYGTIDDYFKFVLQYDIKLVPESLKTEYEQKEEIKNMPNFPSANSVQEFDGKIVIKVGKI